nr:hypothetical protein [Actinomadura verrucosospora]
MDDPRLVRGPQGVEDPQAEGGGSLRRDRAVVGRQAGQGAARHQFHDDVGLPVLAGHQVVDGDDAGVAQGAAARASRSSRVSCARQTVPIPPAPTARPAGIGPAAPARNHPPRRDCNFGDAADSNDRYCEIAFVPGLKQRAFHRHRLRRAHSGRLHIGRLSVTRNDRLADP